MRYKSSGITTPMKSISKLDKYSQFSPLKSPKIHEKTPRFDAFPLPNAQKGVSKIRHLFVRWRVFCSKKGYHDCKKGYQAVFFEQLKR